MSPFAAALPWLAPVVAQAMAMPHAHAILLHGAAGDGLFEAAHTIAQGWLCEGASNTPPCGHCSACRATASGQHPDLHRLAPEWLRQQWGESPAGDVADGEGGSKSKRKPSKQIRIDEVRAAIDWVVTTSSRGRAKVVLVQPAEAMNLQAASALLKTLEEPPRGARLLLAAAEPERLLSTVRSRCQVLRLTPPLPNVALAWLQDQGLAQAEVLLAACSQRPLDALALSVAGVDATRWAAVPAAVFDRQPALFAGWPAARVLEVLQKLCHDGMAMTAGAAPRFYPAQSLRRPVALASLVAWGRELSQLAQRIDHPWSEGLLVDALLDRAHRAWHGAGRASDTL